MTHPITKIVLTLGCAGTLAATASAQLYPTTYSPGDTLVGFREVGNANSVVVDIGAISQFATPSVFAIDAGTTLSAQYGANWATNPNVYYSLVSTDAADLTSYVTSAEYTTGPNAGPAKIWSELTTTNARIFQNKINNFGSEYTSDNATQPEVQPMSDPNAYANFMPGGSTDGGHATPGNIAWGFFNPTSEGNFSQGTSIVPTLSGVELDYIKLPPGSPSTPGTDLGIFQLSNDGNELSFTPEALIVPEPSSYITVAVCGALALLCFRMNKGRNISTKTQSA